RARAHAARLAQLDPHPLLYEGRQLLFDLLEVEAAPPIRRDLRPRRRPHLAARDLPLRARPASASSLTAAAAVAFASLRSDAWIESNSWYQSGSSASPVRQPSSAGPIVSGRT